MEDISQRQLNKCIELTKIKKEVSYDVGALQILDYILGKTATGNQFPPLIDLLAKPDLITDAISRVSQIKPSAKQPPIRIPSNPTEKIKKAVLVRLEYLGFKNLIELAEKVINAEENINS